MSPFIRSFLLFLCLPAILLHLSVIPIAISLGSFSSRLFRSSKSLVGASLTLSLMLRITCLSVLFCFHSLSKLLVIHFVNFVISISHPSKKFSFSIVAKSPFHVIAVILTRSYILSVSPPWGILSNVTRDVLFSRSCTHQFLA